MEKFIELQSNLHKYVFPIRVLFFEICFMFYILEWNRSMENWYDNWWASQKNQLIFAKSFAIESNNMRIWIKLHQLKWANCSIHFYAGAFFMCFSSSNNSREYYGNMNKNWDGFCGVIGLGVFFRWRCLLGISRPCKGLLGIQRNYLRPKTGLETDDFAWNSVKKQVLHEELHFFELLVIFFDLVIFSSIWAFWSFLSSIWVSW